MRRRKRRKRRRRRSKRRRRRKRGLPIQGQLPAVRVGAEKRFPPF